MAGRTPSMHRSAAHGAAAALARCVLLGAVCAGYGIGLRAQTEEPAAGARELLNSERIARRFGGYGVEVLRSDGAIRVSSLYSLDAGRRTCRTFAVVRYPERVDPSFAAEQELIVGGGSIGAVFAEHGWAVRKSHLRYDTIVSSPRLEQLMGGIARTPLALDVYTLGIAKDGLAFDYAAIVEIHHPGYLRPQDLYDIYGPPDESRPALVDAMLQVAEDAIR